MTKNILKPYTIIVGDYYRHFKGNVIEIIGLARNTENLENIVIYKNIKTSECWIRPEIMLLDPKDVSQREDNITGQQYQFEIYQRSKIK